MQVVSSGKPSNARDILAYNVDACGLCDRAKGGGDGLEGLYASLLEGDFRRISSRRQPGERRGRVVAGGGSSRRSAASGAKLLLRSQERGTPLVGRRGAGVLDLAIEIPKPANGGAGAARHLKCCWLVADQRGKTGILQHYLQGGKDGRSLRNPSRKHRYLGIY